MGAEIKHDLQEVGHTSTDRFKFQTDTKPSFPSPSPKPMLNLKLCGAYSSVTCAKIRFGLRQRQTFVVVVGDARSESTFKLLGFYNWISVRSWVTTISHQLECCRRGPAYSSPA